MIVNLLGICVFNLYWAATTLLSISYYKGERVSICLTDPALTLVYHHYHIYTYYDIYDLNPLFSINLRLAGSHYATVLDSAVLIIQYVSDLLNGIDSQSDPADFRKFLELSKTLHTLCSI